MDVKLALLADYANISREGKLNILGIFDSILTSNFPAFHPQMQLIIKCQADISEAESTKKIEIYLIDDDGEKLFKYENDIHLGKGTPGVPLTAQHILIINGATFKKPGDYVFKVLINGDWKYDIPLKVAEIKKS